MQLRVRPLELTYLREFRISRGGSATTRTLLVEVEHEGLVGRGEAVPFRLLGWDEARVTAALAAAAPLLAHADPHLVVPLSARLAELLGDVAPALNALTSALWDLHAQRLGAPLWRLWGLDPAAAGVTSFTLSLASREDLLAQADENSEYPLFKVKCGGPADLDNVRALAEHTGKRLWVDANGGWEVEQAAELAGRLAELGVELIEQPVARGDGDAERLAAVAAVSLLPIVADESCAGPADVLRLRDSVAGINIKLDKFGGLGAALDGLSLARACGLRVMLGCFGSSSVALSAAGQLAPLVDWCDLDGHLLLRDDPFVGLTAPGGRLTLSDLPGLGVRPR